MSFAFHDPKKMPRYEPYEEREQRKRAEEKPALQELQLARVRGYFIGLAKRRGPMSRN
ncbi:hypothetical protein PVT71_14535 [Salipiger sp. H15]|uniref:Uncharacterized protein n=1 Tax=Alloyangia sp. H15 TaxID=3029062 RepID=A0AAU8AMX7_9RHOB